MFCQQRVSQFQPSCQAKQAPLLIEGGELWSTRRRAHTSVAVATSYFRVELKRQSRVLRPQSKRECLPRTRR